MRYFLVDKLGTDAGEAVYALAQERLEVLVRNIDQKSESQKKTLINTILPRIALYLVLREDAQLCGQAEALMKAYMCDVVGASMHKKYSNMEKVPFFYRLYSKIFLAYMQRSDLWQSEKVSQSKTEFQLDIHGCLWHDACVENGCPELCRYFCMCDDITYGGLRKMGFERTQTLGMGGEKCDFSFYKKPRA